MWNEESASHNSFDGTSGENLNLIYYGAFPLKKLPTSSQPSTALQKVAKFCWHLEESRPIFPNW